MILYVWYKKDKISVYLYTGSSPFVTRRTSSAYIFLPDPLCLLHEEQDQLASFYMILSILFQEEQDQLASSYRILSVCYIKDKIRVDLSTWSTLFVKRRTISVYIFLQDPFWFLEEEQVQRASFYTPLCWLREEQDQRASFHRITSVCYKNKKIRVQLSTGSSLFVIRRTSPVCFFLQIPLCLLQEEQDQRLSFSMILSVLSNMDKIS